MSPGSLEDRAWRALRPVNTYTPGGRWTPNPWGQAVLRTLPRPHLMYFFIWMSLSSFILAFNDAASVRNVSDAWERCLMGEAESSLRDPEQRWPTLT